MSGNIFHAKVLLWIIVHASLYNTLWCMSNRSIKHINQAARVVLVVAYRGYQPLEYRIPKTILTRAGYQVLTASNKPGIAYASDSSRTTIDMLVSEIPKNNVDGIFFIGGPGALTYLNNQESYRVLQYAASHHIPFGAICISPRILASAGVLHHKKATGWNEDGQLASIFAHHNVRYIPEKVVVDRSTGSSIVTATGPEAAQAFAQAIQSIIPRAEQKQLISEYSF